MEFQPSNVKIFKKRVTAGLLKIFPGFPKLFPGFPKMFPGLNSNRKKIERTHVDFVYGQN